MQSTAVTIVYMESIQFLLFTRLYNIKICRKNTVMHISLMVKNSSFKLVGMHVYRYFHPEATTHAPLYIGH